MKVSTEIDNNFGYEKITQLVDNIPLSMKVDTFIVHLLTRSTLSIKVDSFIVHLLTRSTLSMKVDTLSIIVFTTIIWVELAFSVCFICPRLNSTLKKISII
jgi:hypothetical protein